MIPHVESTEIVARINMLLEVLKSRNHNIKDWENADCVIDRVEYHNGDDEFYCFFRNEERKYGC